jgi:hypothetical protein
LIEKVEGLMAIIADNSPDFEKKDLKVLEEFVSYKMSMTANYQPGIIRELLVRGGSATKDELALALLLE